MQTVIFSSSMCPPLPYEPPGREPDSISFRPKLGRFPKSPEPCFPIEK